MEANVIGFIGFVVGLVVGAVSGALVYRNNSNMLGNALEDMRVAGEVAIADVKEEVGRLVEDLKAKLAERLSR